MDFAQDSLRQSDQTSHKQSPVAFPLKRCCSFEPGEIAVPFYFTFPMAFPFELRNPANYTMEAAFLPAAAADAINL